MVHFFPQPLPDEIFKSLVLRYGVLSGARSSRQLLDDVFGDTVRINTLPILFPKHLNEFNFNTYHLLALSIEDIIEQLTPFPFYRNFIAVGTDQKVLKKLRGQGAANICSTIGINGSDVPVNEFPKYCPQCAIDDFQTYLQIYWHRVHQLPIYVCPLHNYQLKFFRLPFPFHSPYKLFLPREPRELGELSFQENKNDLIKTISEKASDLLNGKKLSIENLKYNSRILELGYNRGSFINYDLLIEKIISRFGKQNVEELIFKGAGKITLREYIEPLIHKPEKILNPLRHLFFQIALETLEPINPRPTYGSGPWPCLNKASGHFLQPVISNYFLKYDTKLKQEVSYFTCSCGMIYKKYFKVNSGSPGNRVQTTKIVTYGPIWMKKFDQLLTENLTSYKISKILGVDIRTVRSLRERPLSLPSTISFEQKRKKIRTSWTESLESNLGDAVMQVRNSHPKVYRWLYLNDKDWLLNTNQLFARKTKTIQSSINWNEVDKEILQELKNNYELLVHNYPRRISKSLMIRSISTAKFSLTKRATRQLLQSMRFIESVMENSETYQLRKIKISINELEKLNVRLSRSAILSKSNLRRLTLSAETLINKKLK